MKILLLDQYSQVQEALKEFLELQGHEVICIDNPVSAYSICTTLDAQLLISEYFSDDKNYVKLFELINEKKNPTKIIILTSIPYTFREISKLEKIQIEDIMIKPIDPKIILEVIQELETRNVLKIKN